MGWGATGGGRESGPAQPVFDPGPVIEGEPLRVVTERVAMQGRTLRWLASRIDQTRPYYLLGGSIAWTPTTPPATAGGILHLRYARASELGPWLDLVAAKGEIFVQFWLKPGEQAVYFDLGNEPPVDPIPAELKLFL